MDDMTERERRESSGGAGGAGGAAGGADPVTGLPGRRELVDRLARASSQDGRVAVLAVLVHGYAEIAESGAREAEAGLREVADRLGRLVRASDLLALLSPGVFALAGPGVERADSAVLLERVQGAFALPVHVGDEVVSFPVTVGIAHSDSGGAAASVVAEAEADLQRRLAT